MYFLVYLIKWLFTDKSYTLHQWIPSTRSSVYETRLSSRACKSPSHATQHIALDAKGQPTNIGKLKIYINNLYILNVKTKFLSNPYLNNVAQCFQGNPGHRGCSRNKRPVKSKRSQETSTSPSRKRCKADTGTDNNGTLILSLSLKFLPKSTRYH